MLFLGGKTIVHFMLCDFSTVVHHMWFLGGKKNPTAVPEMWLLNCCSHSRNAVWFSMIMKP